jgi:hypothetical protein
MMNPICCFVLASLLIGVSAHPDPFLRGVNVVAARDCVPAQAFFYSFHLHILFEQHVPTRVAAAKAMTNAFEIAFPGASTPCNDTTTSNTTFPVTSICYLEWDVPPARPFPVSESAFFIPPAHFAPVAMWAMQNRGSLDIVLHPNSGCEVSDHRDWPLWGGHRWPLDFTSLHYDCPACTFDSCVRRTQTVFAQPNVAALCGLDSVTFVPRHETQFCSSSCVQWLRLFTQMAAGCPNFCDTGNYTACAQLQSALPSIAKQMPRCRPL